MSFIKANYQKIEDNAETVVVISVSATNGNEYQWIAQLDLTMGGGFKLKKICDQDLFPELERILPKEDLKQIVFEDARSAANILENYREELRQQTVFPEARGFLENFVLAVSHADMKLAGEAS